MTDIRPDQIDGIEGHRVRFRLVTVEDAAYIHALRTSVEYSRHLSPAAPSVEAQRNWIAAYKAREAEGLEYYFVIERQDDRRRCGTMRIYGVGADYATWGSFILTSDKPRKAAVDALLLVHHIIFNELCLRVAHFDVRKLNLRALALYQILRGKELNRDDRDIFFQIDATAFGGISAELQNILDVDRLNPNLVSLVPNGSQE